MEQQTLINELMKDVHTVFDNVEGHIMEKDGRSQSAHLADLPTSLTLTTLTSAP